MSENKGGANVIAPLLRIGMGVGLLVVIIKFTPILDILQTFFTIVLIPLAGLCAVGLVSVGTYNLWTEYTLGWIRNLKEKSYAKLEELRAEDPETAPTVVTP